MMYQETDTGSQNAVGKNAVQSRFFLRSLQDGKKELLAVQDRDRIPEIFLLTAMGTLGISKGFVIIADEKSRMVRICRRGIQASDVLQMEENSADIMRQIFPEDFGDRHPEPIFIRQFPDAEKALFFGKLPETAVLFQFRIEDSCAGIAGFCEKISLSEYSDADIGFLSKQMHIFAVSLHNFRFQTLIRHLNDQLAEKEDRRHLAERRADNSQKELNRQLFRMQSLHYLTQELAGLKNSNGIREFFLLSAVGILGTEKAVVQLLDVKDAAVEVSCRGEDPEKIRRISLEEFRDLRNASEILRSDPTASMTADIIDDKALLENTISLFKPSIGLVFVIDENQYGLMLFGEKITGKEYTGDDRELLLTLTQTLMVFLENARSFETIRKLNDDLEKSNLELKQSVEDLKANRQQTDMLEKAKNRVRAFIRNERKKAGRLSVADMILMLLVGSVLGIIYNYSSPTGIGIIPRKLSDSPSAAISVRLAKLRYDQEASVFVDARPPEFYNRLRIRNAVNLPFPLFDFVYLMRFSETDPEALLIVYGRNISRRYDEEVAVKLKARGHMNVRVMTEGLSAWEKNGFPVEP